MQERKLAPLNSSACARSMLKIAEREFRPFAFVQKNPKSCGIGIGSVHLLPPISVGTVRNDELVTHCCRPRLANTWRYRLFEIVQSDNIYKIRYVKNSSYSVIKTPVNNKYSYESYLIIVQYYPS